MLNLYIFRVSKIFYLEKFLYLFNALGGKVDYLVLFIDNEIPCFLSLHAHDGVHLGQFFHVLATP